LVRGDFEGWSERSQAESLRHGRGGLFALAPALSRGGAGCVDRTSFRGRGSDAPCDRLSACP
jgi:hypothetical protein